MSAAWLRFFAAGTIGREDFTAKARGKNISSSCYKTLFNPNGMGDNRVWTIHLNRFRSPGHWTCILSDLRKWEV